MFRLIRQAFIDLIDLLLPVSCLACSKTLERTEMLLCTSCRFSLPETNLHKVPYVHTTTKFAGKVPVDFVLSYLYFTKGGISQKLIHQIKYQGRKEAAKELGAWYGFQLKNDGFSLTENDVLIGVPLHKSRLLQRGYNQADWIAQGLSESLSLPYSTDILVRISFNESQTRKSRVERWENVKSVFEVSDATKIQGKRAIIVDDVLTTGATIEACAVELLKAGCTSVGVITLAITK